MSLLKTPRLLVTPGHFYMVKSTEAADHSHTVQCLIPHPAQGHYPATPNYARPHLPLFIQLLKTSQIRITQRVKCVMLGEVWTPEIHSCKSEHFQDLN